LLAHAVLSSILETASVVAIRSDKIAPGSNLSRPPGQSFLIPNFTFVVDILPGQLGRSFRAL
jgi:hypothetical protein